MKQAEATKLFEVERILEDVLQYATIPQGARQQLRRAKQLTHEAIAYEDDESHCPSGDDL